MVYREDPFQRIVNVSWDTAGFVYRVTNKITYTTTIWKHNAASPCTVNEQGLGGNSIQYILLADGASETSDPDELADVDDIVSATLKGRTSGGVWDPNATSHTQYCDDYSSGSTVDSSVYEDVSGFFFESVFFSYAYWRSRRFTTPSVAINLWVNGLGAASPPRDPGWSNGELIDVSGLPA